MLDVRWQVCRVQKQKNDLKELKEQRVMDETRNLDQGTSGQRRDRLVPSEASKDSFSGDEQLKIRSQGLEITGEVSLWKRSSSH